MSCQLNLLSKIPIGELITLQEFLNPNELSPADDPHSSASDVKMSCQLNLLSKIPIGELITLQEFLNPNELSPADDPHSSASDWDNDWGWDDNAEGTTTPGETNQGDDPGKNDWLSDCEVSISSLGELITISKGDRLAVLQINYEGGNGCTFAILWKGIVTEYPREAVTSVYCLPLISHKRSAEGAPDWTCVIVGFNTGYVRMYNETGTKVLDHMLHNESVMCIKCKTFTPSRYPDSTDQTEELTILYETVLVSLDGFGLYQTLRACKNRAAMAAATGSAELELPPLGYKKWGLKGQGQASEHISAGFYTPTLFDQMQTASLVGFKEKISSVPPTSNVFACTGDNPFVGVYHAMDGESYHLLNNVTEVATKLLTVGAKKLMSWGASYFRKSEAPPEPEKSQPRIEPATPAFRRHSLYDKRRIGQSMSLSPAGHLAAVTDSLGRVLLIDTHQGVIRRVWKGYRQAQIGWMTVKERNVSRKYYRRHAFFLVIYAPKRGLLEIWLAGNGPRVGAFSVGKGCRLIYPGCSMLGINHSTYKLVKGKIFQCLLLKPDGELTDINIPFHLALSDANSKRAHDQQLMVLLKSALKLEGDNPTLIATDLWEPISKMKLVVSLQYALEKVLSSSYISSGTALTIISNIISMVKTNNQQKSRSTTGATAPAAGQGTKEEESDADGPAMDVESRLLLELCATLTLLVEMHAKLRWWCEGEPVSKVEDLSSILPVEEVASLLLANITVKSNKKVGFSTDTQLNLCDFLSLFDTQHGHHSSIKFHQLSAEQMVSLGRILFEPCLKYGVDFSDLQELIASFRLSPRFMLDALLDYYLSLESPSNSYLIRLESIINSLYVVNQSEECDSSILESPTVEEMTTPELDILTPDLAFNQSTTPFKQPVKVSWWKYIKEKGESSPSLQGYLHIALVCRSICIKETAELSNEFPDPADDFEKVPGAEEPKQESWEHLSVEVAMWSLSIKHLEDVSKLNKLLKHKVGTSSAQSKELLSNIITIKDIRTGNRGLVGELVGRWCVANLLSPSDHARYGAESSTTPPPSTDNTSENTTGSRDLMEPYLLLKEAFPVSLTPDIIYANACWEFVSHWNKETESMYLLKFALDYLLNIENGCLKHGLCLMIWDTYIVKRVSALVYLIEKVGKAPKDRLCKKEIDMETARATEFMTVVCDYMDIFLQANCDFCEPVLYKEEPSWASEETTGHSLAQMACQQRETTYSLLRHHSNLMTLVSAILTFSMKSVKIMSLYDHNGKAAFFKPLTSHPYMGIEGKDELISINRSEFLCRVLLSSVQTLPERSSIICPGGQIKIDKGCDAMRWPVLVMELAELFELDTDHLRKYYVSKLVSHGYDLLALEVIPFMNESTIAYIDMLELCSQRVSYYMLQADQDKLSEITSAASPALIQWLNEKATVSSAEEPQYYGNLVAQDVTMSETNQLLVHVVQGLHSAPRELRFAQELYTLTTDLN